MRTELQRFVQFQCASPQKIKRPFIIGFQMIKKFQTILIEKCPDLPEALLKKFARTRTFFRIRALNAKLKDIEIEKSWRQRQKKIAQFKN